MGTAPVSVKESPVVDSLQKSDFPRLKTSEIVKERQEASTEERVLAPVIQEKSAKKVVPIFTWISAIMLIAQFILFGITFYMIERTRLHNSHKTISAAASSHHELVEGKASSPLAAKVATLKPDGVIADFESSGLTTIYDTPIHVREDESSQKTLKLLLDGENGIGKKGKALLVSYAFSNAQAQKVGFLFNLPLMNISSVNKLGFYFRLGPSEAEAPQISLVLISSNGEKVSYRIGETFSFWKEYRLNLSRSEKDILGDELVSLEIEVSNLGKRAQGTFYLDNISLGS